MVHHVSVKFPFLFFFLFIALTGFGQLADITGTVTNVHTGERIPGVHLEITGTTFQTISDPNGIYKFQNVPAGEIEIAATSVSYEKFFSKIDVAPGQVLIVDVPMFISSKEIKNVTVSARRRTNTQNAVVQETREAKSLISGISRQQISVSQDANAAQVMQRVPGVTVIENRFIMIRGLSERYNSVMINNVPAPSTEVDKRTFSFDLIPSGALDRMIIHKSGTPENPGDFAGGVIKVFTNNTVTKPFTNFTIGTAYRVNTTFQDYYQSEGSPTDLFGFDNGFRDLPSDFPSTDQMLGSGRLSSLRKEAALKLKNNFVPKKYTALPDLNIGFALGRRFQIGGYKLSMVTSINYSQSYQYMQRDFYRYFEYDIARPGELDQRFRYVDDVYEKNNKINIMSNWSFVLRNGTKINFSNLFNQIGENETNLRQGEDFIQTLGWRRHYMLGYRNRSVYTGQLDGTHKLNNKNIINWVAGYGMLNEKEPDLRRFRMYSPEGRSAKQEEYIMITPPSSNLFDASRYYGKLFENTFNGGVDYTLKFSGHRDAQREFKAGVSADYRHRDFSSRYLSYLVPGSVTPDRKAELESLPLSQIFSPNTLAQENSFVIEEGTRPQDAYDATNLVSAGYASVVYPLNGFTVSGGVRAEFNRQTLNSFQGLSEIDVHNTVWNILPFANAIWHINKKSQLRLGYGRTVNRPEFRERAPFLFYDYKLDANRIGNPDLKTAVIDNIDLRYEFYPRLGESISIGAFFKYFDNPVESKNIITSELPQFTYINADFAYNYGVEVEVRKSFDKLFTSRFLKKFAINLNAAYIHSEVDLGSLASAQQSVRQLQGQSPYIINSILSYNDMVHKLTAALSYNIFGTRIFSVGDVNNPDIYELPRHSLDLTITKEFNGFGLKAGIQDILNAAFRFYQDTDRNNRVNDELDKPIFTYKRGSLFNMAFTIQL